jgi:hypothetical protein
MLLRYHLNYKIILIYIALLILLLLYALQLFSPLRLNTDSLVFLSLAESAAEGKGFLYHGKVTHYPNGYPALVAWLDYWGWANPGSLVAINLLFLGLGTIMAFGLFYTAYHFDYPTAICLICLSLLSYILIKHVTLPISDPVFYGLSMSCLLILARMEDSQKPLSLIYPILAILTAALAIEVRTIGVALIPAFLLVIMKKAQSKQIHYGIAIILSLLLLLSSLSLSKTEYIPEAAETFGLLGGFLAGILQVMMSRLSELGELVINIPLGKMPYLVSYLALPIGLICLSILIVGIVKKKPINAIQIYLITYILLLLAWPYRDARFWMPVMPLLIGTGYQAIQRQNRSKVLSYAVMIYVGYFSVTGLLAIGYSTRISFAGPNFSEVYGDGNLRETYRYLLGNAKAGESAAINQEAVRLFERFGGFNSKSRR